MLIIAFILIAMITTFGIFIASLSSSSDDKIHNKVTSLDLTEKKLFLLKIPSFCYAFEFQSAFLNIYE